MDNKRFLQSSTEDLYRTQQPGSPTEEENKLFIRDDEDRCRIILRQDSDTERMGNRNLSVDDERSSSSYPPRRPGSADMDEEVYDDEEGEETGHTDEEARSEYAYSSISGDEKYNNTTNEDDHRDLRTSSAINGNRFIRDWMKSADLSHHPAAILNRLHGHGTGTPVDGPPKNNSNTCADNERNPSFSRAGDETDYKPRGTAGGSEYFENNVSPSSKLDVERLQEEFAARQKMNLENGQMMLLISQKLASAGVVPGAGNTGFGSDKSLNQIDYISQILAAATGFPMFGAGIPQLSSLVSPMVAANNRMNNRICPSSATKEIPADSEDRVTAKTPSKRLSSTPNGLHDRREPFISPSDAGRSKPETIVAVESQQRDLKPNYADREYPLMSTAGDNEFAIGAKTPMASLVELSGFGGALHHKSSHSLDHQADLILKGRHPSASRSGENDPDNDRKGSAADLLRAAGTGDPEKSLYKHRCHLCFKILGSDSALQIHMRSHTGERPYKCNICENRFTTKGNLKVHFQRHQEQYPHVRMNPNPDPEPNDRLYRSSSLAPPPPRIHSPAKPSPPVAPPAPPRPQMMSSSSGSINLATHSGQMMLPTSISQVHQQMAHAHRMAVASQALQMAQATQHMAQAHQFAQANQAHQRAVMAAAMSRGQFYPPLPQPPHHSSSSPAAPINLLAQTKNEPRKGENEVSIKIEPLLSPVGKYSPQRTTTTASNNIDEKSTIRDEKLKTTAPSRVLVKSESGMAPLTGQGDDHGGIFPSPLTALSSMSSALSGPPMNVAFPHQRSMALSPPETPGGLFGGRRSVITGHQTIVSPKSNDNDALEQYMEVRKTDSSARIEELVRDFEGKLSDPNECAICHRVLSCRSALQMHYRTHTGERPYKCKLCSRTFTTKGNLKTHMSVHRGKGSGTPVGLSSLGSAPVTSRCPVCSRDFTNPLILQQHMRSHTISDVRKDSPGYPHLLGNPGAILGNPGNILGNPAMMLPFGPHFMPFTNMPYFHQSRGGYPPHPMFSGLPRDTDNEERELDLTKYSDKRAARKRDVNGKDDEDIISMNVSSPAKKRREENGEAEERRKDEERNQNLDDEDDEEDQDCDGSRFDEESVYSFDERNDERENENICDEREDSSRRDLSFGEAQRADHFEKERNAYINRSSQEKEFSDSDSNDQELEERRVLGENERHAQSHEDKLRLQDKEEMNLSNNNKMTHKPHEQESSDHEKPADIVQTSDPLIKKDLSPNRSAAFAAVETSDYNRRAGDERTTPYKSHPANQEPTKHTYSSPLMALEERVRSFESSQNCAGTSQQKNSNLRSTMQGYLSTQEEDEEEDEEGREGKGEEEENEDDQEVEEKKRKLEHNDDFRDDTTYSSPSKRKSSSEDRSPKWSSLSCTHCKRSFEFQDELLQHVSDVHSTAQKRTRAVESSSGGSGKSSSSAEGGAFSDGGSAQEMDSLGDIALSPDSADRRDGQRYVCSTCNKPFSSTSALQIHSRTHTGDRPFACHVCAKAFTTKGNLKVHMSTHAWNKVPSRRGRRMSVEPSTLTGFTSPKDAASAGIAPNNVPAIFNQYLGVPPEAYLPIFGGAGFPGGSFFPVPPPLPQRQGSALPAGGDGNTNAHSASSGAPNFKTEPAPGMLPAGFASLPPAAAAMAMMMNPGLNFAMLNADFNMRAASLRQQQQQQQQQQGRVEANLQANKEETNNNAAAAAIKDNQGSNSSSAEVSRSRQHTSSGELDLSNKSYASPAAPSSVVGGGGKYSKGASSNDVAPWPVAINAKNIHGPLPLISHCT